MTRRLIALVALLFLAAPAEAGSSLGRLVDKLRMARDQDGKAAARRAILETNPSPKKLLKAIRSETSFPPAKATGIQRLTVPGLDSPVEAHLPEGYSSKKSWPLMIALHGMGGRGSQMMSRASAACKREGWLLLCPTLRDSGLRSSVSRAGTTGFGWGDHRDSHALRCLRFALRNYRIDTNRVYVMGVSLGGYGTWSVGTHHWHRFAAILPYAGGIDYRENTAATAKLIPQAAAARGFLKGLGAQSGGGRRRDLLINLKNLPAFFIHGSLDKVVEPLGDRLSAKELKKLSYKRCRYEEKKSWKHMPTSSEMPKLIDTMVGWAKSKKRDTDPERVLHFAPRRDAGDASWLRLTDFEPGAKVDAKFSKREVKLKTKGVKKLDVFLSAERFRKASRKLKFKVNGKTLKTSRLKEDPKVILECYERWLDPSRLYVAKVSLSPKS